MSSARIWWRRRWESLRSRDASATTGGTGDGIDPRVESRAVVRRAESLASEGRWAAACELLEDHLVRHADDARSHRALSRHASQVWRWNAAPPGQEPERFLAVARSAIERAVALAPQEVAWLAPLGELRAETGAVQGALEPLERAVAAATTSTSPWMLRSKHPWEFMLERLHHEVGSPRVLDPLFACEVALDDTGPSGADPVVGRFRARFTHHGLNVGGHLTETVETVEILLDGRVVRAAHGHRQGALPAFDLVLRRSTLERFPRRAVLEVRSREGHPLLADGRSTAVTVTVPHGDGRLGALLDTGATVDKKGVLEGEEGPEGHLAAVHLELYRRVAAWFDSHGPSPLFALYGTLLGIHRAGDLIPGDDDLDVGYVSGEADPTAVKREVGDLVVGLVREGFTVSINRRGRPFRVHHRDLGPANLHLDVHAAWFEGGRLYVPNHVTMPAAVGDLLPVGQHELQGVPVHVPRRPEVFLEGHYGGGWRVPDPDYVEDASAVPADVMARFGEALLTPQELRDLQHRLAVAPRPAQGRLVAIATQPLYPLDQLLE